MKNREQEISKTTEQENSQEVHESLLRPKAGALSRLSHFNPAPATSPVPDTTTQLSVLSYTPALFAGT